MALAGYGFGGIWLWRDMDLAGYGPGGIWLQWGGLWLWRDMTLRSKVWLITDWHHLDACLRRGSVVPSQASCPYTYHAMMVNNSSSTPKSQLKLPRLLMVTVTRNHCFSTLDVFHALSVAAATLKLGTAVVELSRR
jgi:hypothetical protein